MGNDNNRQSNSTEMSNIKSSKDEDLYDQYVQYEECCGFQIKKIVKKHLIWEQNFIRNCRTLKVKEKWPHQLVDLVKNQKLSRIQFLREINDIKNQQKSHLSQQQEILLSPSEIDNFKSNLKKSVLLSHGQTMKSSKLKETKIESTITPKKVRKNDLYIDHFRKSTIGKENSYQKTHKSAIRESLVSFVDDTISSMFRSEVNKDISKYTANCLQTFILFTVITEKHLSNEQNILCLIKNTFIRQIMRQFQNEPINEISLQLLITNIKQFLIILREAVYDFYNIHTFAFEEINNTLISNSQNILNVVTSILFKHEEFYTFVFQFIKEFQNQKEVRLRKIIKSIQKSPQDFQIKGQYCLTQKTIKKYFQSLENVEEISKQKVQDPPYYKCFLALKEIVKTRTPISKMKIIMDCSQKITESISEFYTKNKMELKNWVIDADQILSIFCYIIGNASIPHIYSHLFILDNFATDQQLISVSGYYYSVLTCAIEQLESQSIQMNKS